jgi:hypothetical protein
MESIDSSARGFRTLVVVVVGGRHCWALLGKSLQE